MNILHINSYDQAGGAEQVAIDLLGSPFVTSKLVVKGKTKQDSRIISLPRNLLDQVFTILDKLTLKAGCRNTFKVLFSITEKFNSTYKKLRKIKAYQESDIIHIHNIHGSYFDLNALLQIAKEKKIVWTLHDMWAVTGGEFYTYGNLNFRDGIGKTSINYLAPLGQPLLDRRQHNIQAKKKIYKQIKDQLTFVPVSEWLNTTIHGSYVLPNNYQKKRIYNGYDHSKFFNKKKRKWSRPRILFFNQQGESKGSGVFLDILPRLELNANFDLYLIGKKIGGAKTTQLHSYIQNREDLCELYNEVDILIFPSKAESFGLMPLEAMACGVCVVSSNATALPEILNNEHGFVFQSGSSLHLYMQVNLALQDLNNCRHLGAKAAAFALANFNLSITHSAYFELYNEILDHKR